MSNPQQQEPAPRRRTVQYSMYTLLGLMFVGGLTSAAMKWFVRADSGAAKLAVYCVVLIGPMFLMIAISLYVQGKAYLRRRHNTQKTRRVRR